MASIKPHAAGGWRVSVNKLGQRRTKVCPTKAQATAWGLREETAIVAAEGGQFPRRTLAEAIERYLRDVSPRKKGERTEGLRFAALQRDYPALAGKVLSEHRTPDWVAWRDDRLRKVTPGTVQRDINLIRNLFRVAADEWRWCGNSPLKGMRMPGENPARDRLLGWREIRRVCRWLGYQSGYPATTGYQFVAYALLLALRTGMRAGELLALEAGRVDLVRRVARVPHKTQHLTGRPREVPLSGRALRLLRCLPGQRIELTSATLDALWRKATEACGLIDAHFHDSRATALTHLARRVDVLTLARISGHRDPKILLQRYYRETAESIAARL